MGRGGFYKNNHKEVVLKKGPTLVRNNVCKHGGERLRSHYLRARRVRNQKIILSGHICVTQTRTLIRDATAGSLHPIGGIWFETNAWIAGRDPDACETNGTLESHLLKVHVILNFSSMTFTKLIRTVYSGVWCNVYVGMKIM